jgi:hypothetical protein
MTQINRTCSLTVTCALVFATSLFAQNKGTLLEGLGVPDSAPQYRPADVKINDGTFRLKWGSESQVMGNLSHSSVPERGWVLLKTGERVEGTFSIKAKQGKKEKRWTLAEVDLKDASDQKRKIPGVDVEDFAYSFKIDDYTRDGKQLPKNPMNNFNPGTVTLANGTERAGLVAMRTSFGTVGAFELFFAADRNADIEPFRPRDFSRATQKREDGDFEFISFNGGIVPLIINGKNFVYFRNPHSTTKATGFRASMANMASGIAADQVGKAAAKAAARSEMSRQAKKGADLGSAINASVDAGNDAYNTASSGIGIGEGMTKPEYVIRNVKTGVTVVVSDETHLAKLDPLMNACGPIAKMAPDERKEFTKFKNLENVVRTLDSCF